MASFRSVNYQMTITPDIRIALGFGKTGGRFNFNINQQLVNEHYNIRDLGYFQNTKLCRSLPIHGL